MGITIPRGSLRPRSRDVVAGLCEGGRLAEYAEDLNSEGVTLFGASCADGSTVVPGRVDVDRQPDGSLNVALSPY